MKLSRLIMLAFLLANMFSLIGQVSDNSLPKSLSSVVLKSQIRQVVMPSFDINALLDEDAQDAKIEGIPLRFGKDFNVNYNLNNSGSWENLSNGDRIWRLSVYSPGAYSINIVYEDFYMPKNAKFHIYNNSKDYIIGGFTSSNNKTTGKFATQPVKGDHIVLEYYEPKDVIGQGRIQLGTIIHAYSDVFFNKNDKVYGSSGSCNNNVNCPEGDDWQNEKRGVAMILTGGGSRICTGSLINNAEQDGTQYFLTADHCLGGEDTWIFMFNYESAGCANQDGPTNMTVQGADLLANNSVSDFALLEITETIPSNYNVYYNGWSNIDVSSTNSIGIHHPSGDIKKISFDDDSSISAGYLEGSGSAWDPHYPNDNSHWRIEFWDDGTTEPGSSGSPLFDQNHRIIGQLHGGIASCSDNRDDYYGKVATSWNNGTTSTTRLRDWLDPNNTGATTLDGFDPNGDCSADINITANISGGTHDYVASSSITASNVISNGANVHYGASSVRLVTGFRANSGVHFRADLNGCTGSSTKSAISYEQRSTDNNLVQKENLSNQAEFSIYPNPSYGEFNIVCKENIENGRIIISDFNGKEIMNKTISSNNEQINLLNQPKGFYIVRIVANNNSYTKKLVLK